MTLLPAIWSGAATLGSPLLRALLVRRARGGKEIAARLNERRGIEAVPRPPGRLLWLHAASVGETVSVLPVLAALAEAAPDLTMLMTTGTVTSARLLATRLPELGLERQVIHRFVPLDVPAWAARFLDHWQPDAAGFVESELWPNLLAACRARAIPAMLVNARLSARSFRNWRRARGLARAVLGGFARVQAQSEADAERLRALGAHGVSAPGNLKFAARPLPADAAELARLRALTGGRPLWLAASTHPGEEAIAAAIHRRLAPDHPALLTIIAPRHPERGEAISAALGGVPRRSRGDAPPGEGGIWLADTLGELGLLYRLSPVVFVGRSLCPPGGGQNPLEPARLECAIAAGPLMENFAEAVEALERAGGITRVPDADTLGDFVNAMLSDETRRKAAAGAASQAASRYAGLPALTAATLLDLMAGRARPNLE